MIGEGCTSSYIYTGRPKKKRDRHGKFVALIKNIWTFSNKEMLL
jgi:hypothetical protein